MEPGETPQEALVREIKEELDAEILVGDLIETVEWDYPEFHLNMPASSAPCNRHRSSLPNMKPPHGLPAILSVQSGGFPQTRV